MSEALMRRFSSHNARSNGTRRNALDDLSGAVGKGVQPPDGTTVRAVVVELYPEWGNGYAQTADGSRFLINERTRGLPLDALRIGDPLTILELSNRGYVVRAEREAADPSMSTTTDGSLSSGSGASGEGVQAPDGNVA